MRWLLDSVLGICRAESVAKFCRHVNFNCKIQSILIKSNYCVFTEFVKYLGYKILLGPQALFNIFDPKKDSLKSKWEWHKILVPGLHVWWHVGRSWIRCGDNFDLFPRPRQDLGKPRRRMRTEEDPGRGKVVQLFWWSHSSSVRIKDGRWWCTFSNT